MTGPGPGREAEIRQALLRWIRKVNPDVADVDATTPLLGSRVLNSLQLTDLLLVIERMRGDPVQAEELRPHVFQDVDTICATFFRNRQSYPEEAFR